MILSAHDEETVWAGKLFTSAMVAEANVHVGVRFTWFAFSEQAVSGLAAEAGVLRVRRFHKWRLRYGVAARLVLGLVH